MKKFLVAPLAALALVFAAPALAGNNAQDSTAYHVANGDCVAVFPSTCFGVTKLSEGLCNTSYCNYYYRYYGYYGPRRVRCDATIWVVNDASYGGVSARNCVYG